VRFSVDAYPDETFDGKVSQIRLNATMTMNVVTYTVVVDTDNSHQRLLPYMTANLQFLVNERKDVLMASNSALRWKPPLRLVASEYRDEYARSLKRRPGADKAADKERQNQHQVWVLVDQNFVRPVKVRTGLSDGTLTEIVSSEVHEGDAVVIGASVSMAEENSVNPFAPVVPANKK
jgi:HlyD family secretion protein